MLLHLTSFVDDNEAAVLTIVQVFALAEAIDERCTGL
jgi:hypothetical protein